RLNDHELAVAETNLFRIAGGGTIVDVTPPDLRRDPTALKRLALDTGLNIVMGCGHYVEPAHPASVAGLTADEIAAELVGELRDGVAETGVRPGIIGEIGTSGVDKKTMDKRGHVTPEEAKVLRGAARAALTTGAAVTVHLDPRGEGAFEVISI